MHSTGQESLWVPQPVTWKCFAVRVHRLRPSPASTCCSAGLAPTGHRAGCECSCAGGLPANASPSLPVCSPVVANSPWEAAASKPFGKWVELGEKGHPGVLTTCGVQLQQHATCVRTGLPPTVSTEDSLPVTSKQGEQKSSPCLRFWESSEVSLHLSRRNRRGRDAGEKLEEMDQEMFKRNWKEKT